MSNNNFGDNPQERDEFTNDDYNDYDGFDSYNSDYDDFKYDGYDDDYSLTGDNDEQPLTSVRPDEDFADEQPLERETSKSSRSNSRRETIKRVADEQQSGIPRKPGVTAPDPRFAVLSGTAAGGTMRDPRRARPPGGNRSYGDGGGYYPPGGRPPQKSKFAMFYIAILLLVIGVCLTVLVMILPRLVDPFPEEGSQMGSSSEHTSEPDTTLNRQIRNQTSLIAGITRLDGYDILELLDISTRRYQDFYVPADAVITGRNNILKVFSDLRIGDIIDVRYYAHSHNVIAITENQRRWERVGRPNVQVDMESSEVVLNNDVWTFNSQTIVLHNGERFSIAQIRPYDTVTMMGHGDTVWFIRVDTAHGFLQLVNTDRVENGRVMIGSDRVIFLDDMDENETIVLPESMLSIMVEGDNIQMYRETVRIQQGQTTRVDLMQTELLRAQLFFVVSPENAQVFINGEEHVGDEPATVDFGEVLIRVELYGYHPQQQEFDVTAETMVFTFELDEIVNYRTLSITSIPTNAQIFINDAFVGNSPITHNVPPGVHRAIARLPGYESAPISITVTGNETTNIERALLLMPARNDPMGNIRPPVEPIPTPLPGQPSTPAPFPTLPPNQSPPPYISGTPLPPYNFPEVPPPPPLPTAAPPWWAGIGS